MDMVTDIADIMERTVDMDTEDTTVRERPSPRPLLLLRPTPRLMLMPTTEATMEAMAWAMVLAMLDLATATEAMVLDTVWDTTERERPRLRLVMARGGVMDTVDMDTEDMDTEPEDTTMARGRLKPRLATTRTGAMVTGPGV